MVLSFLSMCMHNMPSSTGVVAPLCFSKGFSCVDPLPALCLIRFFFFFFFRVDMPRSPPPTFHTKSPTRTLSKPLATKPRAVSQDSRSNGIASHHGGGTSHILSPVPTRPPSPAAGNFASFHQNSHVVDYEYGRLTAPLATRRHHSARHQRRAHSFTFGDRPPAALPARLHHQKHGGSGGFAQQIHHVRVPTPRENGQLVSPPFYHAIHSPSDIDTHVNPVFFTNDDHDNSSGDGAHSPVSVRPVFTTVSSINHDTRPHSASPSPPQQDEESRECLSKLTALERLEIELENGIPSAGMSCAYHLYSLCVFQIMPKDNSFVCLLAHMQIL